MSKRYVGRFLIFLFIFIFLFSSLALATEYRYFSIAAGAFNPASNDTAYFYNAGTLSTYQPTSFGYYFAPVNLPDGAEIIDVTGYGVDDDTNQDQDFIFLLCRYRYNGADMQTNPVCELITSDAHSNDTDGSSGIVSAADPNPTPPGLNFINNQEYSYGLELYLPAASTGKTIMVIRFVVRAKIESVSNFHAVVIK